MMIDSSLYLYPGHDSFSRVIFTSDFQIINGKNAFIGSFVCFQFVSKCLPTQVYPLFEQSLFLAFEMLIKEKSIITSEK